ncbi:hypothetical protein NM688_g5113 [Phlebia brevispora]|uniref:Uncharacterized protein n=1 Tax=Phlebia brevispora TaxID=194682 RepID=A0ACC1T0R5_9APHY|nr:hypothetical protein NM688_g5113 [Phlebia brevispora]
MSVVNHFGTLFAVKTMTTEQEPAALSLSHTRSDLTREAIDHAIQCRTRCITERSQAIKLLERNVLALKYQLNATTSVGHLPAEVLGEVFAAYVADPPLPTYESMRKVEPPLYWWFKLLHVCRRWRQAAISFPRLWTTIYPTHPEVVETLLTRSGVLPLDIRFNSGTCKQSLLKSYKLMMPQITRVRYASLEITPKISKVLAASETILEAPLLEELAVTLWKVSSEVSTLRTMLAPRLRSVTLTKGTPAVLTSLLRASLTSLTLVACHAHPTSLIDAFASLPCLKWLTLENVGEVPALLGGMLPQPSRQVALPRLEFLNMVEKSVGLASAYLLSHLVIPRRARLRFVTESEELTPQHFTAILPSFQAKFQALSDSSMRPRAIRIGWSEYIYMTLWTKHYTAKVVEQEDTDAESDLNVVVNVRGGVGVVNDIIAKFFAHVDLSDVTTLYLATIDLRLSTWAPRFCEMRKLEELGMETILLNLDFVKILTRPRQQADAPANCIFPSLKVLRLLYIKLKMHPTRWGLRDSLSSLMLALKMRQEMGSYLRLLELSYPLNMKERDHKLLVQQNVAEMVVMDEESEKTWSECSSDSEDLEKRGDNNGEDEEVINADAGSLAPEDGVEEG